MKKTAFSLLLLMAFMAAGVQTAVAQNSDSRDYNRGWYAGLSGRPPSFLSKPSPP
ncbi:MAG: hypothetical protein J5971_09290 [Prevotella sp.]|nr:hypothetical protein [Prevotella sp.]